MPTADLLRLADVLDGAGYASLEVSGGGAFDAAVRRGTESPWERIRAIKARTKTPLMLAVRGRVPRRLAAGRRRPRTPVHGERGGKRDRRLPAPRSPERPGKPARRRRGCERGRTRVRRRASLRIVAATTRCSRRPSASRRSAPRGSCSTTRRACSSRTVAASSSPSCASSPDFPVGLYCQGAGRNGLALALEAARAGADLIGCAVYPVALATHRITGESLAQALAGIGHDTGVDVETIWRGGRARRRAHRRHSDQPSAPAHLGARSTAQAPAGARLGPRRAPSRAAARRPARRGARRGRARSRRGRFPAARRPARADRGSQALVNVLGSSRYSTIVDELRDLILGRFGHTPGPIDPALHRAVELLRNRPAAGADRHRGAPPPRPGSRRQRGRAAPARAVRRRGRAAAPLDPPARGAGRARPRRRRPAQDRDELIRSVVQIVQETGVGEITIEEDGVRVSVRRSVDRRHARRRGATARPTSSTPPSRRGSPMASSRSRARWSAPSTAARSRARRRSWRRTSPSRPGRCCASSRR